MILEALRWLESNVTAAGMPLKIHEREDRVIYLYRDGKQVTVPIDPPRRSHQVETIDDFVVAVRRWAERDENGNGAVVFHNHRGVMLICNDGDRRDVVTLPLQLTEVADVFVQLDKATDKAFDQRTFLKLLRRDLRRVIPESLITAISTVEIVSSGQGRTEINPGRERGTREFAADLASEKIPDLVECRVPLYRVPGMDDPYPITCSLDYTLPPRPVEFSFRPLADEMETVFRAAQQQLHGLLCEALQGEGTVVEVDVLYGKP